MELEDAIHTALLTLKEGYEGIFNFRTNYIHKLIENKA